MEAQFHYLTAQLLRIRHLHRPHPRLLRLHPHLLLPFLWLPLRLMRRNIVELLIEPSISAWRGVKRWVSGS